MTETTPVWDKGWLDDPKYTIPALTMAAFVSCLLAVVLYYLQVIGSGWYTIMMTFGAWIGVWALWASGHGKR